MCNPADIQHKIHSFTKDGEDIARFLAETLRGETPGVKVCHRMEAAKQLIKYGFTNADCDNNPPHTQEEGVNSVQSPLSPGKRVRVRGTENTPSPSTGEGWDGGDKSLPSVSVSVTYLDILNYQIAHLIRHETAEGHTVVNFLVDIMSGRDRPFTPRKFRIKPADRMAAARELLRRGFGDLGSRRKLSDTNDEANAYDTLHTDLARRMREYSERGTDTVRFLLEVMSDPDPEEEFTIHHRMSAAQELLRRGWDTNYDNIKPEHLQAYWRDKESPHLSIGQKKTQARLSTTIDDYDNYDDTDYEAIAKEIREEEDRDDNSKPLRFQETVPSSRHSSESKNLEDRQAATPATKLPLLEGEGWGEGTAGILNKPLPPRRGKARMGVKSPEQSPPDEDNASAIRHSRAGGNPEGRGEGTKSADPITPTQPESQPLNKSENVPAADRKAIIKEFKEAMGRGDERAALRAQAKYRRIDTKPEKNIYDYGPSDPDPTVDYYFEPLSPEQQTKFDKEERREHGLTEEEIAEYSGTPTSGAKSDPLEHLTQTAATHNTPILPNPLATKRKTPAIRSP